MGNDQPSSPTSTIKWPIVVASAVGAGLGAWGFGPVGPISVLSQPWQAAIGAGLGALLGQWIGGLLIRTRK
jgi:hypothetical protein